MQYKLVAIDLDDTLLNSDLQISSRNKQAIALARAKGVEITISTGRMYQAAVGFARELGIEAPLITYQGALVREAVSGKILEHLPVPLDLAREIIRLVRPRGWHINLYLDDRLYVEQITPAAQQYMRISKVAAEPVGDLLDFLQSAPTKVVVIGDSGEMDALGEEMKAHFGESLHITKSKPHFLEFSHPQATKGRALAELAGWLHISRDEIIAIGDSYNDLEMIRYAGLGVVMANGPAAVQKVADFVAPVNDADGVALVLEKFILENTTGR